CATGHDPIVSATRTVAVEVLRLDAVLDQILPGRRIGLDRTGRTDVIRRHRIAEDGQRTRAPHVARFSGAHLEVAEEGRLLDVRRLRIPLVKRAGRGRDLVPERILLREVRIEPPESL